MLTCNLYEMDFTPCGKGIPIKQVLVAHLFVGVAQEISACWLCLSSSVLLCAILRLSVASRLTKAGSRVLNPNQDLLQTQRTPRGKTHFSNKPPPCYYQQFCCFIHYTFILQLHLFHQYTRLIIYIRSKKIQLLCFPLCLPYSIFSIQSYKNSFFLFIYDSTPRIECSFNKFNDLFHLGFFSIWLRNPT
jgi:hypothetical protein